MQKQYQLTQAGVDELKEEHGALIGRRSELAEAIKVAREQGDLSENAEYHAAKEDQGRVESRIKEIENILNSVEIISGGKKDAVELGSSVELTSGSKTATYTIVGSVEADPLESKISDQSPMGKALLGKKQGDTVDIELPAGTTTYTIKSIS